MVGRVCVGELAMALDGEGLGFGCRYLLIVRNIRASTSCAFSVLSDVVSYHDRDGMSEGLLSCETGICAAVLDTPCSLQRKYYRSPPSERVSKHVSES